ncbi:HicA-like toxin [Mycobacterium phage Thonko]|uniref:HicA-like toxin n=1 Tax=Mycobacterium phage Thonko TaxID=2282910 RepID=A0A346FCD7_9CAUD|nr:HicA-like toxin [Mycobacterium phage Thonko]AXN53362.1 HicA-like toxin [Mycobacterium phage Thonko]
MARFRCGSKDTRELVSRIVAAGGTVEHKRSGHIAVYLDGRFVGQIASSPSDHRTVLNQVSRLRRNGLAL